jgi:uncharacterized membrane protein YkvA (DUF1232 family)
LNVVQHWRKRVRALKSEAYAVYLASKDPRVPWYARALIAFVVLHTLSPIDLIPDFIPVLGVLDDLVIAPLGIALALKMIPSEVLAACREEARLSLSQGTPTSRAAGAVIVAIWLVAALLVAALLWRVVRR